MTNKNWCLYFNKKASDVTGCYLKGNKKDCKLMLQDGSKEDCSWLTKKEKIITFR